MRKIVLTLMLFLSALASAQVGIETTTPNAALDVSSADKGMLIPRVALTSTNIAAPVTNPAGGNLAESTLVYNTATAGTTPDNVKPGFYYWNGSRWMRFDVNAENAARYYSAIGTTNAASTAIYSAMPEMTITYTPTTNVAYVNFSGAGYNLSNASCAEFSIFFRILVNGVPVKSWQTAAERGMNITTWQPQWDTSILTPVAVTAGTPQTISIQWGVPGCNGPTFSPVNVPLSAAVGFSYIGHRTLTVIDPNGGGGVVGLTPTIADSWSVNGNAGTNPATNFIGTIDDQNLIFRRNNNIVGQLTARNIAFGRGSGIGGQNNVAIGVQAMMDNVSANNNIAIGIDALHFNQSGSSNIAIGTSTLQNNNGGTVNVAIGSAAGLGGFNHIGNTFIGAASGSGIPSDITNATAIGYNAKVTASNSLVLGNVPTTFDAFQYVNVGVGVSAPLHALHIFRGLSGATGNANAHIVIEDNANAYQHFLTPSANESGILFGTETSSTRGGILFNSSGNTEGLYFKTGGNANRMKIQADGNVGIGTTSPDSKLHVSSPTGLTAVRIGNASTSGTNSNVALDFYRGGNANTDWRIYNIGPNLTIGNSGDELTTINDLYQFQGARFMPMTNATINLGQAANRWNTLFASNGTINTSDAREKKNIQNLNYGLDEIMRLRPVSFEWIKDDGSGTKIGLIAQELKTVLPETVRDWDWSDDGKTKIPASTLGVYYSDIIPVLIKGVQEQQQMITSQADKISELEKENLQLKHTLESQQKEILERLKKLESK